MYNSLQSFFLNFVLSYIVFFFDSMFFDLMRNFLIFENFFSFVLVFIELNFIISFFLNLSKCFFQILIIFFVFVLCLFVKTF